MPGSNIDIKKFFRDVGQPLSINILKDEANDSASATVEFESHEDVLSAKTRSGRDLSGREVRIQSGSQNTLYVSNYPPEYDEAAIRRLFDGYGEIISVRFPSLVGVDPAQASPADQDAMAYALYEIGGWQHWPICGQHLL